MATFDYNSSSLPIEIVESRRLLGAYYTPKSAADYMAEWAIRHDGEQVLEPSFGDGIFVRAIHSVAARRKFAQLHVLGVEIDEEARLKAIQEKHFTDVTVHGQDFLTVAPFRVQAVIGNPPYVRLRNLQNEQKERALSIASSALGRPMEPSGSIWMPFVLHAMQFLDLGGRLAFVLPYDLTYVRYARPLWEYLCAHFGSINVLRTHERMFPDILQDVIILFADNFGSRTDVINYQLYERVKDMLSDRRLNSEKIEKESILRGERAFIESLLGKELRQLLNGSLKNLIVPARELVTFNIGYVSGDKDFFHPKNEIIDEYGIQEDHLRKSITSTRSLKGGGLWSSSLGDNNVSNFFLPDSKKLNKGERDYITLGEKQGVADRYKCSIRFPWFFVPGVRVPDIILSVFSDQPVLLVNDKHYFASNSLLCGYCHNDSTSEHIATAWYTSLTLLQCEIEVHALGGGVMVMIPGEAGNVRLPKQVRVDKLHLNALDGLLRLGKVDDAYNLGNREILNRELGLNNNEVELISHGVSVLAHWRNSARTSLD